VPRGGPVPAALGVDLAAGGGAAGRRRATAHPAAVRRAAARASISCSLSR
jgi:hypothetical protein